MLNTSMCINYNFRSAAAAATPKISKKKAGEDDDEENVSRRIGDIEVESKREGDRQTESKRGREQGPYIHTYKRHGHGGGHGMFVCICTPNSRVFRRFGPVHGT